MNLIHSEERLRRLRLSRHLPRGILPSAFSCALVAITAFAAAPTDAESPGRAIFTKNESLVLSLRTFYRDQETGVGSAFVAEYAGRKFLITNYHVIAGGRFYLQAGDEQIRDLEVLRVNEIGDIAVLSFPSIDSYRSVPLTEYTPLRGERVFAMGFPVVPGSRDVSLTITDGLVSNHSVVLPESGPASREYVQVSAALNPGNSGGPIFGEKGRLIGMATRVFINRQNMNLAVRAVDIISEIDQIKQTANKGGAEEQLLGRLDLLANTVKEGNILDYGAFYSPSYKLALFAKVRRVNERLRALRLLQNSRGPLDKDTASGMLKEYLEPEELMYYLALSVYHEVNSQGDFEDFLRQVDVSPFLGSQLYLSGRFYFLIERLARDARPPEQKFAYQSHRVRKIDWNADRTRATVHLSISGEGYSFPAKLKFVHEWGNWFLLPVYDYGRMLRED